MLTVGMMHPDLIAQPEIFRDAGIWRTQYEAYGPEVWEKWRDTLLERPLRLLNEVEIREARASYTVKDM